ncbi:acyl-CoA synthetase short-chain family member 3, mitochondrial-like [Daphnia carinata]|uniref:acyl-CoA synthetase short-chain family member 3, mitochondrial-like n=1 Tax=Daphnia carinata TaxID=120202 RepID=UPI002579AE9E|nr:acyl-CoA synthetase short-chain family member 3, mitochondrial-like [Daphnia carinata]
MLGCARRCLLSKQRTFLGVGHFRGLWQSQRCSHGASSHGGNHLFHAKAAPTYKDVYERSILNPEQFWAEEAEKISWMKPWSRVLDHTNPPFTKWFVGGETNACYNAVDRHVADGHGQRAALIHDSPVTSTQRSITYAELQQQVSKLAAALSSYGVKKGDNVLIYMPMIPEAVVAMLAVVRLGAVHSLVFGGFAARELSVRIKHAEPKVIISASCGVEPTRLIRYKPLLDQAITMSGIEPKRCIIYQRPGLPEVATMKPDRDVSWDDAMDSDRSHDCVPVEANQAMYILYTSGTTGDPKGIQRPTGGHLVALSWVMKNIYAMKSGEKWWAASDLGWVVGHSFICYGPLLAGLTTLVYEGKPVGTPDAGQFFRVIQDHGIQGFSTAPTALRAIRREDPELEYGRKYDTSSLRFVFLAGEHCDYETRNWAENKIKVPVLDHWWQTETGHPITSTCVGLGHSLSPPRDASGVPVPGYNVKVLNADKVEAERGTLGRIVIKLPLPPGTMSTLYRADDRFSSIYFKDYPGFYDSMDAGIMDADGQLYVMSRDDDVINVAGHRLSTSALEEALLEHPCISEAAVVGVPDEMKGELPLGLYVTTKANTKPEEEINKEAVQLVRELVGPVAAFRLICGVEALPKTRSGKIARKSIADLARGKSVVIPPTIEDPTVYVGVKKALQRLGYALNAADPE